METQKKVSWFIFTNDAYTNQVISMELPPENIIDGVKCIDGVERKLWQCDGQFITKIRRNKTSQGLHFEIFKRDGKYGPIKKCDFLDKKKKAKRAVAVINERSIV
jgi:hypothetical protein